MKRRKKRIMLNCLPFLLMGLKFSMVPFLKMLRKSVEEGQLLQSHRFHPITLNLYTSIIEQLLWTTNPSSLARKFVKAYIAGITVANSAQTRNECLKIKTLYWGNDFIGDVPLTKKILAALTTAITVANPTDLVKVRLQAEGKLPPGAPRCYSGTLNAYSTILRQEGVGDVWTGIGPNIACIAIINAAELASYDQVKQVKSRMTGDSSAYKNMTDCFVKTLKNDGPLAFYKGFISNFGRLGSWNVIMFLALEQAKRFVKSIESK